MMEDQGCQWGCSSSIHKTLWKKTMSSGDLIKSTTAKKKKELGSTGAAVWTFINNSNTSTERIYQKDWMGLLT